MFEQNWPTAVRGLFLSAALITSCSQLVTIQVEESATATVEGSGLIQDLTGNLGFDALNSMDITSSDELQNQGVQEHQIKAVYLNTLVLSIPEPEEGQDLSFLELVTFTVSAEELPELGIAWGGPFPEGETEVSLQITDADLAAYVVADSMKITASVEGSPPEETTTIQADLVVDVQVDLQGIACGE